MINKSTTLLIKTDKATKRAAERVAESIGIPLSTILNAHMRQLARHKEVSFSIAEVPNTATSKILNAGLKEYRAGKAAGPFHSVDELMADLMS